MKWLFFESDTLLLLSSHQSCDIEPKDGRSRKTWNESWCEKKPGLLSILQPPLSAAATSLKKDLLRKHSKHTFFESLSFYLDSHFDSVILVAKKLWSLRMTLLFVILFPKKKVILELNLNFLRFKGWVRLIETGLGKWKGVIYGVTLADFFLVIR